MIPEELVAVQKLWINESSAENARAALAEARKSLESTNLSIDALRKSREEFETREQALFAEERTLQQKLQNYQKRVRETRRMIDEGRAPDFLMAERQVESCVTIVEQVETRLLEIMEELDQIHAKSERLKTESASLSRTVETRSRELQEQVERTHLELERLQGERKALEANVTVEHLERFRMLRRQGRAVLSLIKDGSCTSCNFMVPSQVFLEIQRNTRIHVCRHCGRFFVLE